MCSLPLSIHETAAPVELSLVGALKSMVLHCLFLKLYMYSEIEEFRLPIGTLYARRVRPSESQAIGESVFTTGNKELGTRKIGTVNSVVPCAACLFMLSRVVTDSPGIPVPIVMLACRAVL